MNSKNVKQEQNYACTMDKFSGGRSLVKVGDTVTPKPDAKDREWDELQVIQILKPLRGFPDGRVIVKQPDGRKVERLATNLLLTSSSELQAKAQLASVREMVEALDGANASQNDDLIDEARTAIQEDALSVELRSDWHAVGDERGAKPSEYRICLCTGGPAVQITGELNEHGEPSTAKLQHQDWFTPWADYPLTHDEEKALLTYASEFLFA